MPDKIHHRLALWLKLIAAVCLPHSTACGQYQSARSYNQYYQNQLDKYTSPSVSSRQYTIGKYFYHNPAVSPYSNLARYNNPATINNYFRYVVPEQQRRQQVMTRMNQPLRTGGRTLSIARGGLPGAYHNHWYGSRSALGLSP